MARASIGALAVTMALCGATARAEVPDPASGREVCRSCTPPEAAKAERPDPRHAFNEVQPRFEWADEAAALEAVQLALTQVGDGSSYVWYRRGGRLSGIVHPTRSFRDALGRVCRHLKVTLSAAGQSRQIGTIACRLPDGRWTLDG